MRTFLPIAILTLFASSTIHAETTIRPLIASEQTGEPVRERLIDRSSARPLLRMTAPVKPRRLVANLRHDADLTTLDRPLVVRDAEVGKIVVEGATSLRLRVTSSAPGTVLLVAGEEDQSFERFEPSDFATWTPTTRGSTMYLAVEGAAE